MSNFKSGKNGRCAINGNVYKIKNWRVSPRNQLQDVTHGNSGGYGEYIAGVSDLNFSFEFDHDVGTNPFGTDIIEGATGTFIFYVDGVAAPNWNINGILEEIGEALDVRGLVVGTASGRATSVSGVAWIKPTT